MSYRIVKIVNNIVYQYKYVESIFLQELYQWFKNKTKKQICSMVTKTIKKKSSVGIILHPPFLNPYQWLKKTENIILQKGCSGDFWSHNI